LSYAAGAVFAVLLFFLFFEDAEGFSGEIRAIYIFRVKNVEKFVTRKNINTYLFKPDPTRDDPTRDPQNAEN